MRLAQVSTTCSTTPPLSDRSGAPGCVVRCGGGTHGPTTHHRPDSGAGIEDPEVLTRPVSAVRSGRPALFADAGGLGLGLSVVEGLTSCTTALSRRSCRPGARGPVHRAAAAGAGAGGADRLPNRAKAAPQRTVAGSDRGGQPRHRRQFDASCWRCTATRCASPTPDPDGLKAALGSGRTSCSATSVCRTWTVYGVARALRINPLTAQTRLLAVSGYTSAGGQAPLPPGRLRSAPDQAGRSRTAAATAGRQLVEGFLEVPDKTGTGPL